VNDEIPQVDPELKVSQNIHLIGSLRIPSTLFGRIYKIRW